eukprot:5201076-Prymnesium_polylepis.1
MRVHTRRCRRAGEPLRVLPGGWYATHASPAVPRRVGAPCGWVPPHSWCHPAVGATPRLEARAYELHSRGAPPPW